MISIGIPFYNCEKFLEFAILSVLNQTYRNWELILVDDGSTDDSLAIAQRFSKLDNRIRVVSDGLNKKLPYRLNQIISISKFEYIARMDADDIMDPYRLEKQLNFLLKNNNYDLVSSSIYSIDTENNILGKRIASINLSKETLLNGNYQIVHPSLFGRKSWFQRNQYDISFDRAEDYELWLRSILKDDFKIYISEECLLFYRELGNLTKEKLINSYKTTHKIFEKQKSNIPRISFIKGVCLNSLKILIVNFLFAMKLESILSKRRNDIIFNEDELKTSKQNLKKSIELSGVKYENCIN